MILRLHKYFDQRYPLKTSMNALSVGLTDRKQQTSLASDITADLFIEMQIL
jgi:hypothetical protein